MTHSGRKPSWRQIVGWTLVVVALVGFVWGMNRRARLDAKGTELIRMLFVPSVEQGTLVQRGDELARFIRQDSGLIIRSEVPTSYAAVIQALGSGQADVAWMPAFAYVVAHAKYGAEAKLQVVRSADHFLALFTRNRKDAPQSLADLSGEPVAVPSDLKPGLREQLKELLDREAPGWIEVEASSDKNAVALLHNRPLDVTAAASSHVPSGPNDFVGDGRKELEYDRPGTVDDTAVLYIGDEAVEEETTVYHGCIFTRTDSGARRLEDFTGQRFAFSDETSTSGHLFPRLLLDRAGVTLGRVYYAGGHPNVVQAVWDGKALGGSAFYSPANKKQRAEGLVVGDARYIILRRMKDAERRRQFLEDLRVLKVSDPIPNDLCAVREGFPPEIWERFQASLGRFIDTENGKSTLFELLAGVGVAPTDDASFDDFRSALSTAGIEAAGLLEAAEERLEKQREEEGAGS